MNRFGYCCINLHLQKTEKVTTNRTMRKATFLKKGLDYASELTLSNVKGLRRLVTWNNENGIDVFRASSDMVPWASEYKWEQLPDIAEIKKILAETGKIAKDGGQRLSFHPGPFNCLTSKNPKAVKNAVTDLTIHGDLMDMLGQPRDHRAKINIHIGGAYGDRDAAIDRWVKNFELLPESVKSRLTVENDDRPNLYSVKMLYEGVYKRVGVPIVFDSLHYKCGPQDQTYKEAIDIAVSTWQKHIRPVCHHSNSRKLYEDDTKMYKAHSDYYYTPFDSCGHSVDVSLEAKAKEQALLDYRNKFC